MMAVIRYASENNLLTKKFSSICDARLIWGGNDTINKIRKYPVKEISRDLAFADRNSFCIFNTEKLIFLTFFPRKKISQFRPKIPCGKPRHENSFSSKASAFG